MVSIATDAMNALRRAHTERSGDVDLRTFLLRFPELGDDELADLIELDARERLRAGKPVALPRYMDAIPDLPLRRVALDAAIEFALRSLSGSRHTKIEAVEALCAAYPDLVPAISAAWFLNDALGSTTGASVLVQPPIEIRLPMFIGQTLPSGKQRYELRERVGVGSHGSVYLGVDHALSEGDRPAWVAVKLTSAPGSHAISRRVSEEATKARRVTHPNIARVLDRGMLENAAGEYIVYEHVDAGDLQDAHDRGRLPKAHRELAALVMKIARAVQAAHTAGLIHSDIKPSNILLTSSGEPKVADFGLAGRRFDLSENLGGVQLGTLGFIAPERYRAEPGSESVSSDVYSLGGVLYYLLTGKAPNGSTPDEVADRLGSDSAAPLLSAAEGGAVDPDLAAICRRAMAPKPQDRHPSADALANDLEAWIEHRPLPWRPSKPAHLALLFAKRNPVVCIAGAVFLVGLFAATVGYLQVTNASRVQLLRQELDNKKELEREQMSSDQRERKMASNMISLMQLDKVDLRAEWLWYLTVSEAVAGPAVLGTDGAQKSSDMESLWKARIDRTKQLIGEARARGAGGASDATLWSVGLGFWKLRAHEYAEAREILAGAAREWGDRWGPEDHITVVARTLAGCAEVREIQKRLMDHDVNAEERGALERDAAMIKEAIKTFTGSRAGGNVHRESLAALVIAYSPKLLNDPGEEVKYKLELANLR